MRIAINTRFLIAGHLEGYGNFTAETMRRITQQHPEHEFYFLFDRPFDKQFAFSNNITPIVIGPPARHAVLFKWWYDVRVPATLRKIKADVFVSTDGFCSLVTKLPQVLVVHDLAFLHHPGFIKKSHLLFYKRYTPKFIAIAKQVATVSQFSKQDILAHYKTDPGKISVIGSAAREIFQPVSWQEKEAIKEQYTDGKEYFLFSGAIHPRKNLVNLLKAFSLFKKRQLSNMQLVLCGRMAWQTTEFEEKLATYKYRSDVKLLGFVPEPDLAKLTASAYAVVYPSLFEGFGLPILEAMQCGVPVITSNTSSMPEVGRDAALYADPTNPEDIATQMKLIYKDENLRAELIVKGEEQVQKYSWQKTADALWELIEKAKESSPDSNK
ncbi:MAG: glycosyltransferase family 1 protein [Bacteroidota bacterium]